MAKKLTGLLFFASLVLGLALTGCPNDPGEENGGGKHAPYGSPPHNGKVTGEAAGRHQGGPTTIKISLTLEEGYITAVSYEGSEGITNGIGSRVREQAPAQIIARNSVEEIDAFTHATVTRELTIAAGKKALNTIPGVNLE